MNIYGEYPISFNGDKAGELKVKAEGIMTSFDAVCTCKAEEILRLAIISESRRQTLGVMMPDGDKLIFRKRYSKNDLIKMNLTNIESAVLITQAENSSSYIPNLLVKQDGIIDMPEEKAEEASHKDENLAKAMPWEPAEQAGSLFADEELKLLAEKTEGIMRKDCGDGVVMAAVPLNNHQPFSMMPIFCFGRTEKINNTNYLVFNLIDGNVQS